MGSRNDNLVINPDEMNDAVSGYNHLAARLGQARSSVSSGYTGMRDAGFFSNGLKEIGKQLGAISKTVGNVGKSISNQTRGMLELDAALATKASEIEIPNDFVANNSMALNEYNKSLLEKLDGKSVNEGNETTEKPAEVEDSVIAGKLDLTDITSAALGQQELQDNLDGTKQQLDNINHTGGEEMQHVDDSRSFDKEQLVNINTNGATQKTEMVDAYNVSKKVLTDMTGGSATIDSAVVDNVLGNLNSGSTGVAKEELGNALNVLNNSKNSPTGDMKTMSSDAVDDVFRNM